MENKSPAPKHERMEALISEQFGDAAAPGTLHAACVRGYVACFNAGQYYEAHDVLEHYWLQLPRTAPEYSLYKGLIQLAGGFVHLRLNYLEPLHRVHGRRLEPASKLFALAQTNLSPHLERETGFEIVALLAMIQGYSPRELARRSGDPAAATRNPWSPLHLPQLRCFLPG